MARPKYQKGWETALEAALGARLNAIVADKLEANSRSPSALTLAVDSSLPANQAVNKNALYALIEKLSLHNKPLCKIGFLALIGLKMAWMLGLLVKNLQMAVSSQ